jgi:hypothetical protein
MNGDMYSHQSELLYSYLDGETSATEEDVLFKSLAENEELRTEMRDLLAIRNAIHSDKGAFTPSIAATAAVFTGLGFAAPSTAAAMTPIPVPTPTLPPVDPASTSAVVSLFGGAAQPLIKPLIGAIVGSALTVTAVTTVIDDVPTQGTVHQATEQSSNVQLIQDVPEAPPLSDLWIDVSQPPAEINVQNPVIIDKQEDVLDASGIAITNQQPVPSESINSSDLLIATKEVEQVLSTYFGDMSPERDRIIVQLMNNPLAFSNPSSKMQSQSDPYLLNMRAGVFYILDDHHSFGIETGRNAFAQKYDNIHPLGNASYEQNPIAWWVSAAYKYQTGELTLIPGLRGFIQANAGGALELGPLGSGTIGLQYGIAPGILFQVGAEGSMLIYKLDKKYFTTEKFGLIYGLSLQF